MLDPFIYHALYTHLNNVPDPFQYSRELVNDSGFKGLLVESVVASHLLLAQQLFEHIASVEYDRVLMYRLLSEDTHEVDFVLCIAKGSTQHRFLIESKYRRTLPITLLGESKIVLTKDTLEGRDRTIYIPIPLFLMLF